LWIGPARHLGGYRRSFTSELPEVVKPVMSVMSVMTVIGTRVRAQGAGDDFRKLVDRGRLATRLPHFDAEQLVVVHAHLPS
jgi:hypothetical protein